MKEKQVWGGKGKEEKRVEFREQSRGPRRFRKRKRVCGGDKGEEDGEKGGRRGFSGREKRPVTRVTIERGGGSGKIEEGG